MAAQLPPTDEQSIAQLVRRIINGLNGVVDRQIQLFKQEIKEDISAALGAGKMLGIGIGVGIVGALILLNVVVMMIVLGLNALGSLFIPYVGHLLGWFVILILIGGIFFAAYKFVMRGIHDVQISPVTRTRETLLEDISWAKQLLTRSEK